MTEREQEEMIATRHRVWLRAGFRCEVCGDPINRDTFQLAHRIPQRKHLLKRYGKKIIHHATNLAATCSERCNAAVSLGEHEMMHRTVIDAIEDEERRSMWWES